LILFGSDIDAAGPLDDVVFFAFQQYLRRFSRIKLDSRYFDENKISADAPLNDVAEEHGVFTWKYFEKHDRTHERIINELSAEYGVKQLMEKGGRPEDYLPGVCYHYPWVPFSMTVNHGPDSEDKGEESKYEIYDGRSGYLLAEGIFEEKDGAYAAEMIVPDSDNAVVFVDGGVMQLSPVIRPQKLEVVGINKIFILLPESDQALKRKGETDQQFDVRKKRYEFNFKCIEGIADAINKLNQRSRHLVEVKPSKISALKDSLECSYVDDFVVMWGDHSGSEYVNNGVTGIFADGDKTDWIYVHEYNEKEKTGCLRRGNPEKRYSDERHIVIKITLNGIKQLINYGCYGNLDHNQKRFKVALGENNIYLGKYDEQVTDRVVTLDMIIDLLKMVKDYVKESKDRLKNECQPILEQMYDWENGDYIGNNAILRTKINEIKRLVE
jgi:hypothetical protein